MLMLLTSKWELKDCHSNGKCKKCNGTHTRDGMCHTAHLCGCGFDGCPCHIANILYSDRQLFVCSITSSRKVDSSVIWQRVVGWVAPTILKDWNAFIYTVKWSKNSELDPEEKAEWLFKTSGTTHPTTRCQITEELTLQYHRTKTLKAQNISSRF